MKGLVVGAVSLVIALVLFLILNPFVTVQSQELGVVTEFGAVKGVVGEGFHFINPFVTEVVKIDITKKALPVDELAYSKDGQIIGAQVTVNYHVDPTQVEKVFREVRKEWEGVYILPRTKDAIKDVLGDYTAQEIIDKRGEIPGNIKLILNEKLAGTGIILDEVLLTNVDFDDAYEAAIKNKQVQQQEALAQVNITAQEEQKKQQEILRATALAEKTRLEADALATSNGEKVIEKLYAEAALEAAKRWDGSVPQTMYNMGDSSQSFLPIFNMNR